MALTVRLSNWLESAGFGVIARHSERLKLISWVVATEVGVADAALEVLVVFVKDFHDILLDENFLCLVETLLVFVVDPCKLVVGVPLTVATKARHAMRRIDWGFIISDWSAGKDDG